MISQVRFLRLAFRVPWCRSLKRRARFASWADEHLRLPLANAWFFVMHPRLFFWSKVAYRICPEYVRRRFAAMDVWRFYA